MSRRTVFSPSIVIILLVLNGLAFYQQLISGSSVLIDYALWPLGISNVTVNSNQVPQFHIWQLVSYSFLHGGLFHLLLNMYALWFFGTRIERAWGSKAFAIYYLVCVIGAGLVQLVVATHSAESGDIYPTVGASGGVFGLLLAFGLTFPNEKLMLLFPPIPMKAKWFVVLFASIEIYAGVTGTLAGIAHFAHLGGMLFGFLILWYWSRKPLR